MIIVKAIDGSYGTENWAVYHKDTLATHVLELNNTGAANARIYSWNNTEPTDSSFTVGSGSETNGVSTGYVAYLFAHDDSDESMIKCGSYTGNGNANGHEIDLGFEPQFLIVKRSDQAYEWGMFDNMRGLGTKADPLLQPSNADAEGFPASYFSINANGFSPATPSEQVNANNGEYIYVAIRRPNKPAEEFDPEGLFAIDTMGSTGDGKAPAFRSDLPIDMAIRSDTGGASHEIASRLASGNWLKTDQNAAEGSVNDYADFDFQNGWSNKGVTASNYISHMWRRARGSWMLWPMRVMATPALRSVII